MTTAPSAWRKHLVRAGRLCLIALLLGLSWSTARSLYRLFRPSAVVERTSQADAAPLPIESLQALPPDGYWTFSEFDWRFGQREVAAEDVLLRLEELAREPAAASASPSPEEASILKSLAVQGVASERLTPDTLAYRWEGPLTLHALVRERSGERRLVATVLELPSADKRLLLEVSPQTAERQVQQAEDHLLPLPLEATRVLARWSQAGDLQLEYIASPHPLPLLVARWQRDNWQVRPFVDAPGEGTTYLCQQGSELILVYEMPGGTATNLLLVRAPR